MACRWHYPQWFFYLSWALNQIKRLRNKTESLREGRVNWFSQLALTGHWAVCIHTVPHMHSTYMFHNHTLNSGWSLIAAESWGTQLMFSGRCACRGAMMDRAENVSADISSVAYFSGSRTFTTSPPPGLSASVKVQRSASPAPCESRAAEIACYSYTMDLQYLQYSVSAGHPSNHQVMVTHLNTHCR